MSTLLSKAPLLSRFATRRDGIAAVEFALITPVLILVMAAALDFGNAFYKKLRLVNAVTAAAHFALSRGQNVGADNLAAFLANVKSIVVDTAVLPEAPHVTVLFNNSANGSNVDGFYCVAGSPPVWTPTGSSSSACGGNVSSGKFVTITAEARTEAFFVSDTVLGAIFTIKDAAIVRIR